MTLKDGTVIKSGDDLTKYTEAEVDSVKGSLRLNSRKISCVLFQLIQPSSRKLCPNETDCSWYFENTYVNTVNGVTYASNTVRTTTPKLETPTPSTQLNRSKYFMH